MVAESQSFALGLRVHRTTKGNINSMNNSSQFDGVVVAFVVINPGLTINEICAKSGLFRHEVVASRASLVALRKIELRDDDRFYHRLRRKHLTLRQRLAAWLAPTPSKRAA